MLLDTIHGLIDRRVLLNYRVDPDVMQKVLPPPFRPKTYSGWGVAGICLIRFRELRPHMVPAWLGFYSENAAHRFAVQWTQDGQEMEGVYIPRRDTNSGFNKAFGGRVFPGIFNRSTFHVSEDEKHLSIQIIRADGGEEAAFSGEIAERLPETSIFPTLKDASDFFILGSTGYSATCEEGHYHGMELSSQEWSIAPVDVVHARSAFFANAEAFPEGSIQLDCALVMRKIAHEWHSRPDLYVSADGKCLTTKRKAA